MPHHYLIYHSGFTIIDHHGTEHHDTIRGSATAKVSLVPFQDPDVRSGFSGQTECKSRVQQRKHEKDGRELARWYANERCIPIVSAPSVCTKIIHTCHLRIEQEKVLNHKNSLMSVSRNMRKEARFDKDKNSITVSTVHGVVWGYFQQLVVKVRSRSGKKGQISNVINVNKNRYISCSLS